MSPTTRSVAIRRISGMILAFLSAVAFPPRARADLSGFFNGHGIDPIRGSVNELPFEQIDPLTGNVFLTFTDLALPGNGGFDLKIQRTYNSKVYRELLSGGGGQLGEDSWAGFGWTLHMGRVLNPLSLNNPRPVVEMPDGTQHELVLHPEANTTGNTNRFQTRELWTYERNTFPDPFPKLRLPNGVVYTFAAGQNQIPGIPTEYATYATRIEDAYGNHIDITYNAFAPDTINTITQTYSAHPIGYA